MRKLYALFLLITVGLYGQTGSLCTDPIVINSLPYTTTDNTANYGDNYDPPTATPISCGAGTSGNYYLGGNDVIYAYTPTANGNISIQLPSAPGWTGLFVYTSCAGIGAAPYACNCSSAAGNRTINDMAVTAGQTYYIVISSWPSPQTIAYTLNVTQSNLDNSEFNPNKTVTLYPNPVRQELFVETDASIKNVSIISVNGQRLAANLINNNSINVDGLSAGFYILEMTTEEGLLLRKNFIKAAN
ncbi:T9SS type A sorting domain-containing protein [Flavobacterium sp.]|uniref:T9SS type A sorting domain-containing protein n=1 Tax=Flavobacterium sp. TaxID=239 RepID=UPI0025CC2948|nr:T9SS type A sorting domain-containing protein [Flavobacterium sp.]